MGHGDPGRDLRGLRADLPPRRDRRNRALFPAIALDPVSRTRCGVLHAAPQSRERDKAVDDRVPAPGRLGAMPGKWFMTVL